MSGPDVGLNEYADTRIGYFGPSGKDPLQAAVFEREDEDVSELVVGRLLRRIEVGVGRAELPQHRVDHGRDVFRRARGRRVRAEADPRRPPTEAI